MASIDVLHEGYARNDGGASHVGSTVSLVRSGDLVAIIDPGMVGDRQVLLDALAAHDVDPIAVTDVVLSHHHPDHTVNTALFAHARIHDHWATYTGDVWDSRPAEGFHLADDVVLWETPGRERVVELATRIVPGHGPAFDVTHQTPR